MFLKEATFLNTLKRQSYIHNLIDWAYSYFQFWVRYERWSDYENNSKKHKQQERHQKIQSWRYHDYECVSCH